MPKDIDSVSKVIILWRDRFLVLERIDGDGWELPGGHLNEGEKFAAGAKREVYEETKIKISKLKVILKQKEFRLYTATPKILKVKLSNEHTAYKWVNKRQFLKLKLSRGTKLNLKKILETV
jgi:8-oxo-dGTP pyrophosphatase MutT (NUDIX family)